MTERVVTAITDKRREIRSSGGIAHDNAYHLLVLARGGKTCQWEGLGRRSERGIDQVDAERLLWSAVDAGLAIVLERKNIRGDYEQYRWRLTEAGEAHVAVESTPIDIDGYLKIPDGLNHPVLANIRLWLERGAGTRPCTRFVLALGTELRLGRVPIERILSLRLSGSSKAVRIDDFHDELQVALGFPPEDIVRTAGRVVRIAGPIRFRVGKHVVDARSHVPWLTLPPETIDAICDLEVEADCLMTVENLVPFEEEARRGLGSGRAALYIGGFPGGLEKRMLNLLAQRGIRRVEHWGDLDLGGLRILRHLQDISPVPVTPYRMEAAMVERMPGLPLTENDRVGLAAWIADSTAPARDVASAILSSNRKIEQEAWYLDEVIRAT